MDVVSIGRAALMIGVSISCLRIWEKKGTLVPAFRTPGRHRRYFLDQVLPLIGSRCSPKDKKAVYAYARVSGSDQKEDLVRQKDRLIQYCTKHLDLPYVLADVGSGLNCKKPGLKTLIQAICEGRVGTLVLASEDRLLRFGAPLVFQLCQIFGTKIVILDEAEKSSFEQELVHDVIMLMTVFTAKLHGKRSHKNRKLAA